MLRLNSLTFDLKLFDERVQRGHYAFATDATKITAASNIPECCFVVIVRLNFKGLRDYQVSASHKKLSSAVFKMDERCSFFKALQIGCGEKLLQLGHIFLRDDSSWTLCELC